MPKNEVKNEVKKTDKPKVDPADYPDYGDYIAAKKAAEAKKE